MTAESFLDRLQNEKVIDAAVIAKLRKLLDSARSPVSAQHVAGLLVDKGHLTKSQAKKLLQEIEPGDPADSDELGLAENADAKAADTPLEQAAGIKPPAAPPPPPQKRWKGKTPAPSRKENKSSHDSPPVQVVDDGGGFQPVGDELTPLSGDDLMPLLGDGLTPLDSPAQAAGSSPLAAFRGKRFRTNQWDSPWLLIGGGLLILLLMLGGWLVFVLTKGDATELFKAAENSYRGGAYSDAIDKYTKFLETYPEDENAVKARVNRGLSRLALPVSGNDWQRSLEVAQEQLPEIEADLADVPEARTELANQLTKISQGLVAEAVEAARSDTKLAGQLLALTEDAMKLVAVPSYVPSSESNKPLIKRRIDEVKEDVKRVQREISKEEELVSTVDRMLAAANAGKTMEAFEMRLLLMRNYGEGIAGDPRIMQAVQHAAEKERDLVQTVRKELQPAAPVPSQDISAQIILATRQGDPVPELDKQVAVVLAQGAAYGLDAGSGKIRWRHFVGEETTVPPQRMSSENDADALLADSRDDSLLRVDAFSGQPKWRLKIGKPFASPVIGADRILIADQSGRLFDVNPETGVARQHVQFPQNLFVGPGVSSNGSYIYQVGEHSNVYVLSASDMKCLEVLYLGHKAGSVVTTPAVSQGHVFVAVNSGGNYCVLHPMEATNRGRNLKKTRQTIRLSGQVVVPLQRYGNRVVAVTNLGAIHVFEIDASDEDEPVQDIARFAKRWSDPVVGYPSAESGYLWVADRAFSIFQLQTARGEISQIKVLNDHDTFLAAPQLFGETVVHVRRRRGEVGTTVTAVNGKDGAPYWRTELAVPIAGDVVHDPAKNRLAILTAQASLFEVDFPPPSDQPQTLISNDAEIQAGKNELKLDLTYGIVFPDGTRTYTGPPGSQRLLRYDPNDSERKTLRFRTMSIPKDTLAAQPVPFSDGMLVPASNGLIYHLDPALGRERLLPFQPPLEPGEQFRWHTPTVLDAGNQFVAVDGRNRLHLLEIAAKPKPHLAGRKQLDLPPDVMGFAVAGSRVFVASRGPKRDVLVSYQLPELGGYQETAREMRITWGPQAALDSVLYATDEQQLVCVGADHSQRWTAPLEHGLPIGQPAVHDGDFFIATASGSVVRLAADSGKLVGSAELRQPLARGPYFLDGRMFVIGKDGVVHFVRPLGAR